MPTIDEMRKSQADGSTGKGTDPYSFAEKNACNNHGTGLGEGKDETFPEASDVDSYGDKSGY